MNFSFKRYSRLHLLSKQQFLTYKLNFISVDDISSKTWIPITNIGEILRSPPLVETKLYLTLQSGRFEKGRKKSEKSKKSKKSKRKIKSDNKSKRDI